MFYPTQAAAQLAAVAEAASGGYIDFDGSTCDECDNETPCAGWNMIDRRCECGNNRVYWEFDQTADGQWYYYAATY